jgi:hypothetical protein
MVMLTGRRCIRRMALALPLRIVFASAHPAAAFAGDDGFQRSNGSSHVTFPCAFVCSP